MAVVTPVRIRDWTSFYLFWYRGACQAGFWILTLASVSRSVARLAQLVERQPFKLVVVGSSPTVGAVLSRYCLILAHPWHAARPPEGPHGVMDNALDF